MIWREDWELPPAPQKRGTVGILVVLWKGLRDRGHPPPMVYYQITPNGPCASPKLYPDEKRQVLTVRRCHREQSLKVGMLSLARIPSARIGDGY